MAEMRCSNVRWGTDPDDPTKRIQKTCGADLTEAKNVRGDELVRCPECGRKIGTKENDPLG